MSVDTFDTSTEAEVEAGSGLREESVGVFVVDRVEPTDDAITDLDTSEDAVDAFMLVALLLLLLGRDGATLILSVGDLSLMT